MKNTVRSTLIVVFMLTAPFASACQFDTDCDVGSKCVKSGYSMNGACVGGLNPGNANDRNPVYDPLDLNRGSRKPSTGDARGMGQDSDGTYGDTCSFDVDCGPGGQCIKGRGIYGTCM
jgi:hypothetical protein